MAKATIKTTRHGTKQENGNYLQPPSAVGLGLYFQRNTKPEVCIPRWGSQMELVPASFGGDIHSKKGEMQLAARRDWDRGQVSHGSTNEDDSERPIVS